MKKAIVCGGAGFIGTHLIKALKQDGYYVVSLDRKMPEFEPSVADENWTCDLRHAHPELFVGATEVYQLACEVGGLGYIMNRDNDAEMLRNSVQINLAVLEAIRSFEPPPKIFYASSACVYPSLLHATSSQRVLAKNECAEEDAYPADPDNEYAWEKIFSERLYDAYARNYGIKIAIGRLHNSYGPLGTWIGGREKAPAALCRKVAEAPDGGEIEIWGSGEQTRSFTYVDDTVEGIVRLMRSDYQQPVNIGSSQMVTLRYLADTIMGAAKKRLKLKTVDGPVGVQGRNSDNARIREVLGWQPVIGLTEGISKTYPWIAQQVDKASEEV